MFSFIIMMVFNSLTSYRVVRHLTLISIIVLIITSVYYLNLTLEFMKKLIEHIEDADRAFARHAIQNITISKILIAPLQRSANDMYQKHGKIIEKALNKNLLIDQFFI